MPSRAQRSASQYQVKMHSTQTTRSVSVGRDGLEKWLWARWHIPVHQNLPILVQDTEVHGAGVQVDATIKLVLFGVESHEVSSS